LPGFLQARVAEHQPVGGQGDGLAHVRRGDAVGQRGRHGLGGLGPVAGVDGLAEGFHPGVVRLAVAGLAARQAVLVEQLGERRADARLRPLLLDPAPLGVGAEAHRLPQKRQRLLLARQIERGPGPPGEHDAVHVRVVLDAQLQLPVGLVE